MAPDTCAVSNCADAGAANRTARTSNSSEAMKRGVGRAVMGPPRLPSRRREADTVHCGSTGPQWRRVIRQAYQTVKRPSKPCQRGSGDVLVGAEEVVRIPGG